MQVVASLGGRRVGSPECGEALIWFVGEFVNGGIAEGLRARSLLPMATSWYSSLAVVCCAGSVICSLAQMKLTLDMKLLGKRRRDLSQLWAVGVVLTFFVKWPTYLMVGR